jgi:hypothetical protein
VAEVAQAAVALVEVAQAVALAEVAQAAAVAQAEVAVEPVAVALAVAGLPNAVASTPPVWKNCTETRLWPSSAPGGIGGMIFAT